MTRIRFNTQGSNLATAMQMKETVRRRLREAGIAYEEIFQLPYEIELEDRAYTMFCLVWDDCVCEWKEVSSEKGPAQ